jgi:pilus assembly protein Flp/PilA
LSGVIAFLDEAEGNGGQCHYRSSKFLRQPRRNNAFGRESMKNFADSVKKFLVSEDGPTAVEYAVMMALIIVVCIGTITTVGSNANTKFGKVKDALS